MTCQNSDITMNTPADNEINKSSGSLLALATLVLAVTAAAIAATAEDED